MLMQNNGPKKSDDTDFAALLSNYAAPAADDGFSQAVLTSIDIAALQAAQTRQTKLRLYSLYGAAFLGGAVASLQLPSLMGLLGRVSFMNAEATAMPHIVPAGIILSLGLALWALLDSKAVDIF